MKPTEWFDLWMTLLGVVGGFLVTVLAVYLGARWALSHDRKAKRLDRQTEAMEAVRTSLNTIDHTIGIMGELGDINTRVLYERMSPRSIHDEGLAVLDEVKKIQAHGPFLPDTLRGEVQEVTNSVPILMLTVSEPVHLPIEFSPTAEALSDRIEAITGYIEAHLRGDKNIRLPSWPARTIVSQFRDDVKNYGNDAKEVANPIDGS